MNRMDKPFKVGDRVEVSKQHYPDRPVGTTGTIDRIPQERWHQNEVTVAWDDGEHSTLAGTVLDKIEAVPRESNRLADPSPTGEIWWGFLYVMEKAYRSRGKVKKEKATAI